MEWRRLTRDSFRFLTIMHAFRWATEPGTRSGGVGLGRPYLRSAGNLHGWADGDPFYVNYVGHPLQGAAAGRLFLLSDPRFNRAEFGKNRDYWKAKLRATAFSFAFSTQFEIGPVSEASIGYIQSRYPQQGFVDHVITPVAGLGWTIGEDAIDRFIIRPIEDRTENRWVRLFVRSALNPSRTFANVVDGKAPWYRSSRAGVLVYTPNPPGSAAAERLAARGTPAPVEDKAAPFEFSVSPGWRRFGSLGCAGGGAEGTWRVHSDLQVAVAVGGCKLTGLQPNLSGDALLYQVGPRWTPAPARKLSPYAHVLVGGMKVTQDQILPDVKASVLAANRNPDPALAAVLHELYTRRKEANGLAFSAGTGVDYRLSSALAWRLASVEYQRSTIGTVGGMPFDRGLQLSTGMVLRIGTW